MSFAISAIPARTRNQASRGRAALARDQAAPLSGHDLATLRQAPLLSALSPDAFDRLAASFYLIDVPREAAIFSQGDPSDTLHIILSGRVALSGSTPDHRACILEVFGPREGLLDPSALIGAPHPVSARAIEPSRLACLPYADLRAVIEAENGVCRGAVAQLVQHWRLFLRRLEDQKLRSAPQRLASYLVECAEANGTPPRSAATPIRFVLAEDRRTLASHLGMTPENLSRVIGQLRSCGVQLNGRAVAISDLAALRQFGCAASGH